MPLPSAHPAGSRRLLNRLPADLIATFPAALTIAGEDLGAPRVLLQRWPTAQALAAVSREEIIEFARAGSSASRPRACSSR